MKPCKTLRLARGWSVVRLAGLSDCTVEVITAMEAGAIAELKVGHVVRVAAALGCSVLDLVPGFAVRRSEGGRIQEARGRRRTHGKARNELVRRTIVEVLRERGGQALAADVQAVLEERYQVPKRSVVKVRREMGLEGLVEAEQLRGVRPGLQSWVWRIRPQATADSSERAPKSALQ